MKYINAILMVVAAGASVAVAAFGDNVLTQQEGINIAIAVFGAAGVYLAPITPDSQNVKWALAALVALLTATVNVIGAGSITAITPTEVFQIIAIAAAAITSGALSVTGTSTRALLR